MAGPAKIRISIAQQMIDLPLGIDVAFYQKEPDWGTVRAADVRFAFIRASQGDDIEDSQFQRNWREAKRAKVLRGTYHFYDPAVLGLAQARQFIRIVGEDKGELPPVVDVEWVPLDLNELRTFCTIVQDHFGRSPIIYTRAQIIDDVLHPLPAWMLEHDYWLASYRDAPPPALPKTETVNVVCWQQASNARIPGITDPATGRPLVDRDYWPGDLLSLWRYADMSDKYVPVDKLLEFIEQNAVEIEPPPPPPPPPEKFRLAWPAEPPVVVTQPYGVNPQNYPPPLKGHEGIDMRAINGSRIFAAATGQVYRVETNPDSGPYGIHVRIRHEHADGVFKTVYAHLQEARVAVADEVAPGQVIGLANNTGNSFGAHLHLTLKLEGVDADGKSWMAHNDIMNPTPYLTDLFPGEGWRVDVGGNLRTEPRVAPETVMRFLAPGPTVQALEFQYDWWKILTDGTTGWFWNPGYKLSAI